MDVLNYGDVLLVEMVQQYMIVIARGDLGMVEFLDIDSPLHRDLAEEQDRLGWDNFVEGRIGKAFIRLVDSLMMDVTSRSRMSTIHWGKQLVTFLLQVIHSQWLVRNLHVHHKKLEGIQHNSMRTFFTGWTSCV